jgi:predicted rRNA methylase YqxC with S4 and FtsJ domains
LERLRVNGKVVCDLGAADATFMFCAFLAGAQPVFGVEFAENIGSVVLLGTK